MLNRNIARLKCKGLTGKRKNICIKNEKERMLNQRILFLKKSINRCKYSKHPVECKAKIDQEILRMEEKLKDYFSDVGKKIITSKGAF
jgi:hypothetical protein